MISGSMYKKLLVTDVIWVLARSPRAPGPEVSTELGRSERRAMFMAFNGAIKRTGKAAHIDLVELPVANVIDIVVAVVPVMTLGQ